MKSERPQDATHVSDLGIYYKLQGNFWFVYHDGGWYAVSGKPSDYLKEI